MSDKMDRTRLLKLLAMTTSDNDGEALNAMRKANAYIDSWKMTWEDVLTQHKVMNITLHQAQPAYQGDERDWDPPHLRDKVVIDTMFRAIYAQPRSDNEEFWTFMDSVHQYWKDKGRLTPKQFQAIRNCYQRVRKA